MYSSPQLKNIPVKERYFYMVFNTNYTLGFRYHIQMSPSSDVCSVCLQLQEKIKPSAIEETKNCSKTNITSCSSKTNTSIFWFFGTQRQQHRYYHFISKKTCLSYLIKVYIIHTSFIYLILPLSKVPTLKNFGQKLLLLMYGWETNITRIEIQYRLVR